MTNIRKKHRVIACGVLEPYLTILAREHDLPVEVTVLDAGLHAQPNELRTLVQEEIDRVSPLGEYSAVVLLYGLCGRGTANLAARGIPVVIPRVHDCISLFLGSAEEYGRQFSRHPGTFYHSLGWIEKKTNPRDREAGEFYANFEKTGYDQHPDFKRLGREYGEENARHILAFFDRWKQHYTRAAYIDLGLPGEEEKADYTRRMAGAFGWRYEQLKGDLDFLLRLLTGPWEDPRFFVLPPHHRSMSTGDDRLFEAVPDTGAAAPVAEINGDEVVVERSGEYGGSAGVGLGIDAGGTFTDAVLYDFTSRRILAKAKALTTYHDLVEGIRGALAQLPAELLARAQVTALSTTLATNAIVEGKGYRVGLLVLSPWDWTWEEVQHEPVIRVPGCVSIAGEILQPLDESAAVAAARRLVVDEGCAAVVVAGYALTRNPIQANRLAELVRQFHDVPVLAAHELSGRLNMFQAAQTALANARLLPIIRSLLDSVKDALAAFHVSGRLMVVKGDGTSVDESIARARPVETILSGPAASARGALLLSGLQEALVMDIGGTTTDCAILEAGCVAVCPDGARVGAWTMTVDAIEVTTVGLGGDSRLDFDRERRIRVGPRRNLPLCYLADRYPAVAEHLRTFPEGQYAASLDASPLDVFVRDGRLVFAPTPGEARLLDLLAAGPVPALEAARRLGVSSPLFLPLERLEDTGAVKRGALTPTDLLHVTGEFTRWNAAAARRALAIFAALLGRPADDTLRLAWDAVTRRVFEEAIRRQVSWERRRLDDLPEEWDMLLDKAFERSESGLGVRLALRRPIVAIGRGPGAARGAAPGLPGARARTCRSGQRVRRHRQRSGPRGGDPDSARPNRELPALRTGGTPGVPGTGPRHPPGCRTGPRARPRPRGRGGRAASGGDRDPPGQRGPGRGRLGCVHRAPCPRPGARHAPGRGDSCVAPLGGVANHVFHLRVRHTRNLPAGHAGGHPEFRVQGGLGAHVQQWGAAAVFQRAGLERFGRDAVAGAHQRAAGRAADSGRFALGPARTAPSGPVGRGPGRDRVRVPAPGRLVAAGRRTIAGPAGGRHRGVWGGACGAVGRLVRPAGARGAAGRARPVLRNPARDLAGGGHRLCRPRDAGAGPRRPGLDAAGGAVPGCRVRPALGSLLCGHPGSDA
jgi:hypothetical protein